MRAPVCVVVCVRVCVCVCECTSSVCVVFCVAATATSEVVKLCKEENLNGGTVNEGRKKVKEKQRERGVEIHFTMGQLKL